MLGMGSQVAGQGLPCAIGVAGVQEQRPFEEINQIIFGIGRARGGEVTCSRRIILVAPIQIAAFCQ